VPLSEEEIAKLIAAAQSDPEGKEPPLNEVERFVVANNIKAGKTRIQAQVIWNMYKDWTKNNLGIRRGPFFHKLKELFIRKCLYNTIYYMLDPSPFDMSENGKWLLRKRMRNDRLRKKLRDAWKKRKLREAK
jgi:hypothetical protein